jgi:tetratricopeptide (TPR) repeat protein
VIERLAAARDLLLLVEEAHGATPEERRFLARLMARLPALPVVTVSQSPGPGLEGREVLLRPLRRDDIAVLVAGTLRCAAPPDDLIAFLNRECGGLPAFIVLAMRDLHSRGVLRARGAGADGEPIWMLDPLAMNESASGLRPALRYILKGLTPSSRKTLDVLSLAGEPLPLGLVQRALDMDPSAQELAEPLRAGLVSLERRLGEEWLSIRRPVIADTALETLDLMARRGLHQRLADALEGWDEGDWRDRRLTIHRLLGAPTPPTPFYLLEFARGLVDSGEHGKALDILGYLEGSQDLDAETTALLGILRGWALLEQGRRDLALSSFGLARQLALEDSYEALVAEARVGLAAVYWEIGETRHCASHLAEVRVGLLGGESRGRRAWLLGACAWYRGDLVVAQRLFDEAKAAGGLAAVDAGLCEAALLMEISENDEAGRLLDEVILALELKVQPRRLAMALYFRCLLACRTGELRTAVQLAQALQDAGQRQNDALHLFLSGLAWAQIYLLAGDAQRAARQLRQGRGSGDQGVNAHFRLEYRIILGLVRYSLGDRQAALSAFDQGAELARSMGRDTAAAICEGMAAVLTAEAAPLTAALEVLSGVGNHRWRAMLLLAGAVIVGDALALAAAVDEARRAGDSYLLLRALHAMGGPMARAEAASLASGLSEQVSEQAGDLRDALTTLPELQWALAS